MRATAIALFLLAGCNGADTTPAAPDLETAAIERGMVRDPEALDPVGLYARDTDRLCVVAARDNYRIGAFTDYGDGLACNAAGTARRTGNVLRIDFGSDCAFDARFDGDRIAFPGRLPPACAARCGPRASLAAMTVERLSNSPSEAASMRDTRGRLPCSVD